MVENTNEIVALLSSIDFKLTIIGTVVGCIFGFLFGKLLAEIYRCFDIDVCD